MLYLDKQEVEIFLRSRNLFSRKPFIRGIFFIDPLLKKKKISQKFYFKTLKNWLQYVPILIIDGTY